jgi:hypothetical protein
MPFFSWEEHSWDIVQFQAAYDQIPMRFELASHNESLVPGNPPAPEWLLSDIFENHNLMRPQIFTQVLSTFSVMIGIGRPVV